MNTKYMQSADFSALRIAVIGGGAAGMVAAGVASSYGADVTIYEHTDRLGKKLAITGKGRCNVTNDCDINEFLESVRRNPRFLYAALNELSPAETIAFFEGLGVRLKTERGKRVFPESDKAIDIVKALRSFCSAASIVYKSVTSIVKRGDYFVVKADDEREFDKVILATGGRSYPLTGSNGSGFRLAKKLGHTVTELTPSLVPLESPSKLCPALQGLSLKNVAISLIDENGRSVYKDFGEMMFTHFGVTGPMILSASAHLRDIDPSSLTLFIDLKPALDDKTLDARLVSEFSSGSNKDFINVLSHLLPSKLVEPFAEICGIDPRKKVNSLTREERATVLRTLKGLEIPLSGFRPIEEAIITSGGVEVREIVPKTMESKIVPGLYFAGEMIDVDAYTGGFNLQIAFSTGYLAGKSAAEF